MATISAALICKNEESNLPAWLEAVHTFADQIAAVDSGSTDRTTELLDQAGAVWEQRDFTGYADQRNHCASLCTSEWIIFLDADERPDPELQAELIRFKQAPPPNCTAYELSYKVFFFGRFLRHGGFFPEHHLRMYKRGSATWPQREVHERLEVSGPVGRLAGYVEHHSYNSIADYLIRMERYSAQAAEEMHARGKQISGPGAWGHAAWAFISRYFLRLGLLDGYEGYLAARLESLYTLTKYSRLRELNLGIKD